MSDFWVFGYGSLMWRPGFEYAERVTGRLLGAHRALCVWSFVHRGTEAEPGLVLGLDRGGSCRGVAFRDAPENRDAVLAYLRERELVTDVYREAWRTVRLDRPGLPAVPALAYLVDRHHRQYAGRLDRETLLETVRRAKGRSGVNTDYVVNTAAHLRELGFPDPVLDWLAGEIGEIGAAPKPPG
jgi:cation transport protein ChaC